MEELENLEHMVPKDGLPASLVAILGAKSVGKTRLIRHFLAKRTGVIYFKIAIKTPHMLYKEFTELVGDKIPALKGREAINFESFLTLLFEIMSKSPLYVVFDDFHNFNVVDKHAISTFQKIWDQYKATISGSVICIGSGPYMHVNFEANDGILKDRATGILHLDMWTPYVVADILKDKHVDIKHLLFYYTIFGGIPKYYSLLNQYGLFRAKNPFKLIPILFIDLHAYLRDEGIHLLSQGLGKCCPVKMSILHAIACGTTQMSKIAAVAGIRETSISKYLGQMVAEDQILERRLPATVIGDCPKIGRYHIQNPVLRFWFRYFYSIKGGSDCKCAEQLSTQVNSDLESFMEYTFIDMTKEFIRVASGRNIIPFTFYRISSYWDKFNHSTVDIVAIDENGNNIFFCSCRVNGNKFTVEDSQRLINIGKTIQLRTMYRQTHYALISCEELNSTKKKMLLENGIRYFTINDILSTISAKSDDLASIQTNHYES